MMLSRPDISVDDCAGAVELKGCEHLKTFSLGIFTLVPIQSFKTEADVILTCEITFAPYNTGSVCIQT